jgi:hypothetical protein
MDQKVTPESFKAYRAWQKYMLATHPKLSNGCTEPTLKLYCFAMASHGANGLGCYASDAVIAKETGKNQAKLIRPYRHEALRLGWFVRTGGTKGRTQVLDIAIPADIESGTRIPIPAVAETPRVSADGHVSGAYAVDCPGCQKYQRDVEWGDADSSVPAYEIHQQALAPLGCSAP